MNSKSCNRRAGIGPEQPKVRLFPPVKLPNFVAKAWLRFGAARPFVAGALIGTSLWITIFVATAASANGLRQVDATVALALFVGGFILRTGIGRSSRAQRARCRRPAARQKQ